MGFVRKFQTGLDNEKLTTFFTSTSRLYLMRARYVALDEGIAKMCKKYDSHNSFLGADVLKSGMA